MIARLNSPCHSIHRAIKVDGSRNARQIGCAIIARVTYKRIATEEAFATREQIRLFRKLLDDGYDDPGFVSQWGFYRRSPSERARFIIGRLQNLGPERIADMDASGIDVQVLSLTSPGVQVF